MRDPNSDEQTFGIKDSAVDSSLANEWVESRVSDADADANTDAIDFAGREQGRGRDEILEFRRKYQRNISKDPILWSSYQSKYIDI